MSEVSGHRSITNSGLLSRVAVTDVSTKINPRSRRPLFHTNVVKRLNRVIYGANKRPGRSMIETSMYRVLSLRFH